MVINIELGSKNYGSIFAIMIEEGWNHLISELNPKTD
jgi:hypothetical protein